ncbi:hypothetical protein BH09MYX1_BH09MYX1_31570 [soil metagenome]
MRSALLLVLPLAGILSSCGSSFADRANHERLVVIRKDGDFGSPTSRIPINFSPTNAIKVRIEAHRRNGTIDTEFNGFVRVSIRPGTVYEVGTGSDGRNVKLVAGVADDVAVSIIASYGEARVWAEDVGYTPVVDLTRKPPPACSDGIDNDGDGRVDFPTDAGCFAANDDSETEGTFATCVIDTLYYALPRIADVRGVTSTGGTATPFPKEQLRMDTGFDPVTGNFAFDVVVVGLTSDGFYATDVQDQKARGFASVFMFTFSAPQRLGVCDRLRTLHGTAGDFFGYTEIGFPTWTVEAWDPKARNCLVPEPTTLSVADLKDTTALFKNESGLVRVESKGTVAVRVGKHFGPGKPTAPDFLPTDDATSCDLNGSGKIDFSDPNEATCSSACTADPDCSEYQNYLAQGNFSLVVTDGAVSAKAQANGSASADFDPVLSKGQAVRAFSGALRYFSGGNQFTITARCADDVITDMSKGPIAADTACVRRTDRDPNLP